MFAATIDLKLRPSLRAVQCLLALHGAAVGLTLLAQPPKWAALALAALFALSWARLRRHPVFGYGPRALARIVAHAEGEEWTVEQASGERADAQLLGGSFVHPLLIVLNFKRADGKRCSRALLGDETSPELLRRLRARLLNAAPTGEKASSSS